MVAKVMPIPDGLVAFGTRGRPFETVAKVTDLALGEMRRFTRTDVDLLLVRTENGICVTDDRCPHMSAPLSLGTLEECVVSCPLHSGRFDVCTGDVIQFPTTGGLDADGGYHAPWTPPAASTKPEPAGLKSRARALTRIRRLRFYPVRISGNDIEVQLPA